MAVALDQPSNVLSTRLRQAVNWGRKYSLWPMPVSSYNDISRFGAEAVRFSPRQSDLLLVAGTVSYKMVPILKMIYAQMCEPKWVISMGVCACSGGFYNNYSTLQGVDTVIPVDHYVAGCPPTPENLLNALVALQDRVTHEGLITAAERHGRVTL